MIAHKFGYKAIHFLMFRLDLSALVLVFVFVLSSGFRVSLPLSGVFGLLSLALSCLALPCLILSYLVLPCLILSCLALPCLVLSCLVLSCLVLSCLVLSCLVWSYLVL